MREIILSDESLGALESMPVELRERALQKIRLLADNPAHPSLNAHRLKRAAGKWECYITSAHRIIYDSVDDELRLWKIGDHTVVDRVQQFSFSPHTAFRRLESEASAASKAPAFEIPEAWLHPRTDRPPDNPFGAFPPSYLRILGVPTHLVKAVRTALYLDDLERMPGLPEHALNWLLDLATNSQLEAVLFDPARLLFRTTLDHLEGYCEGRIKRLMLNLVPEQKRFVDLDRQGTLLLRGCAGSGKTTVAIYRAMRHAETGDRVIFLTFNRTLAAAAHTLLEELVGPLPESLHVVHLDAWLVRFLKEREHSLNIISNDDQWRLIQEALTEVRQKEQSYVLDWHWSFFRDEIGRVIKGNGLTSDVEYLAIERYGRKTALRDRARRAVWAVYQAYQVRLQRQDKLDWADVALMGYRELLARPLAEPYEHVVIDEAQDLTAVQLRVAQRLNKGGATSGANRSLFLVGDVAQTLYSRGFSWKQAGLALQGRSFSLQRNFRNTRQIAEAAAVLYANNRLLKAVEEFVDPEFTQRQGPWPIIIECDTTDREQQAVIEKILSLIEGQQFRLADFAILCPTLDLCDSFRQALNRARLECVMHTEADFDILEERVKILTIHSAKGLEFPVVCLAGLHTGTLPRRVKHTDDEEGELQVERDRSLMYVGMTRAAEALYLLTSRQGPSSFLAELGQTVRHEACNGGAA